MSKPSANEIIDKIRENHSFIRKHLCSVEARDQDDFKVGLLVKRRDKKYFIAIYFPQSQKEMRYMYVYDNGNVISSAQIPQDILNIFRVEACLIIPD